MSGGSLLRGKGSDFSLLSYISIHSIVSRGKALEGEESNEESKGKERETRLYLMCIVE